MNNSLIAKDSHPTKGFASILQLGLKALNLAITHKAAMDDRLPGTIDALTQDLDAFGAAVPGTVQKRHESVAATTAQDARSRQGHARVRAIRKMVRKAGALKEVQRAYGVGQQLSPTQIKDVMAALQQIVDRATGAPQEAAGLGLSPIALVELTSFLASLTEANKTQEKKRATAPLSTKERNLIGNRILQTVALIAGAGMLAFADNPSTYASFEALLARSRKAAPKTDAKAETKTAPKAAPKTDAKADAKAETKAAPKTDAKAAAPKTEAKPEVEAETKTEVKSAEPEPPKASEIPATEALSAFPAGPVA